MDLKTVFGIRHTVGYLSTLHQYSARRPAMHHQHLINASIAVCRLDHTFFLCYVLSPRNFILGFSVGYQNVYIYPCLPIFRWAIPFGISLGFTFSIHSP
jgi:hypothetical protein